MNDARRIYPVFLPHAGCPFRCVYCNQNAVVSTAAPTEGGVVESFSEQLSQILAGAGERPAPGELAFYGGTFGSLPREVLRSLLDSVIPFVSRGIFTGIRFSTRPESMTEDLCNLLRDYPVQTVELGVQSLSDEVLEHSRRGYTAQTVADSSARVRAYGWSLGIQMMLGLPGDSRQRFHASIAAAIRLDPAFLRLYPTLVLEGTPLADWFRSGAYRPLALDVAVEWAADAFEMLLRASIPVARMGLHDDPRLREPGRILGGPHHPAFGYLVRVEWWRRRVEKLLPAKAGARSRDVTVHVPARSLSEVLGPGRSNIDAWRERSGISSITVLGEPGWPPGHIEID